MNDMFTLENIRKDLKAYKNAGIPVFKTINRPNWANLNKIEIEPPVMEQDEFKDVLKRCFSTMRNLNSKDCLEMTQGMLLLFFFGGYKKFVEYARDNKYGDQRGCLVKGTQKYFEDKRGFAKDLTIWKCAVNKNKNWEFFNKENQATIPVHAVSLTEYIIQMNEYIIDTYCKQKSQKDRLVELLEKYAFSDLTLDQDAPKRQDASNRIDPMESGSVTDLKELLSLLVSSAGASTDIKTKNKKTKARLIAEGMTWLLTACVLRSEFPADQDEFNIALDDARKNAPNVKVIETEEKRASSNTDERKVIPKCLTNRGPLSLEIDLVGRDDVVKKVRAMLDQQACISLVSGLGGIGKTAVMQKVYDSIYKDGIKNNHVAWITCGGSLEDDLLAMRDALGVPKEYNREDAYAVVVRALKTFPGTLYLFMDDMARMPGAAEMRTLTALGPDMRIMITSRHEITGISSKDRIDLFVLAEDDALEMFYRYYQRDNERKYVEDAKKIIESDSVRRHTLLMELIAKAANRPFDTLDVFRGNLEKKGFFEVSSAKLSTAHDGQTKLSSGHDENLTIEESVIKLYEISGLTVEQKRIMSLFSIFTPERVIYGKVVEWAGFDENDVEELVKLGWLVRTEGGYVVHQIVKDSIARQVGDGLKIEEYGELLYEVVDTDNYMPRTLEYTIVRERLVLAEDVARSVEDRIKRLLEKGEWSENDEYCLAGCSVLLNNIALVYRAQGDYAKALEYNEKALEIIESIPERDHPYTAQTYNNMALVYYAQGDYAKALEYNEKALEIIESILGRDHPDTAMSYNTSGYSRVVQQYGRSVL